MLVQVQVNGEPIVCSCSQHAGCGGNCQVQRPEQLWQGPNHYGQMDGAFRDQSNHHQQPGVGCPWITDVWVQRVFLSGQNWTEYCYGTRSCDHRPPRLPILSPTHHWKWPQQSPKYQDWTLGQWNAFCFLLQHEDGQVWVSWLLRDSEGNMMHCGRKTSSVCAQCDAWRSARKA